MMRCVYSKRVGVDFKDTSQSLHSQTITCNVAELKMVPPNKFCFFLREHLSKRPEGSSLLVILAGRYVVILYMYAQSAQSLYKKPLRSLFIVKQKLLEVFRPIAIASYHAC